MIASGGRSRLAVEHLHRLVVETFTGAGVPAPDAESVATVLLYADLRGIESHGIHRVPAYLRRVRAGLAGGSDRMVQVGGSRASRRYDAGHALGPAAAIRATDLATDLAATHGIGLVSLGRSTHFGAAGCYATRVACRGMVGIVLSNGPSAVAPHGAAVPMLGTNPLAIGIPLGRHGEFVLDMSTAAVARERMRIAATEGELLEPGTAIDADGHPTLDPLAALGGSVLPVGGPKGSGLGLAITLLTVLFGGGDIDDEIGSMYTDFDRPQNLGQLFIALNPAHTNPGADPTARLATVIDRLHTLRPLVDGVPVRYSGERAADCARERRAAGIPVDPHTLRRIADACTESGLPGTAEHWLALAATTGPARHSLDA